MFITASKSMSSLPFPTQSLLWAQFKRLRTPAAVTSLFAAGRYFPLDLQLSNRDEYRYALTWVKAASATAPPISTGFLDLHRRPLRAYENIFAFTAGGVHNLSPFEFWCFRFGGVSIREGRRFRGQKKVLCLRRKCHTKPRAAGLF